MNIQQSHTYQQCRGYGMSAATYVRLSSPCMPTSCGRHIETRKVSQKITEKQKYLFDNTFKKTNTKSR